MDSHQEHVLREVAQKNIRFIRLWFTDVAGVLKSISIDPGELEDAFAEGIRIRAAFSSVSSSAPPTRGSAS